MTPSLVSCIIPVLNGERYLREALESIRAQTYRPLEIIVADDGSTDGTAAIVAGFGDQVHYLWQANSGPAAARNLGLRAAHGEFVGFLDADDLWHPEKLTRQMSRFQARPDLDLCITYVQNFWIPELIEEAARYRNHRRSQPMPGYFTGSLLVRSALFNTVGRFNATLWHADDTEWFIRAIEHRAVVELLPDVLAYHRIHRSNISRRQATDSREEYLHVLKAALDRRRRPMRAAPSQPEVKGSHAQPSVQDAENGSSGCADR